VGPDCPELASVVVRRGIDLGCNLDMVLYTSRLWTWVAVAVLTATIAVEAAAVKEGIVGMSAVEVQAVFVMAGVVDIAVVALAEAEVDVGTGIEVEG